MIKVGFYLFDNDIKQLITNPAPPQALRLTNF